jgi:hypothetical protein
LKVTGKRGSHLFGAVAARDEITNLLVPGPESSFVTTIPGASTTAIARYRADIGSGTLGGLLTSRRGESYENTVLAADSYHRLTERDSLRVQVAGSRSAYPDAPSAFNGHALAASYSHNDRDWSWGANYDERAPEFRADSGFLNQVGVRSANAYVDRRIHGDADRWYRRLIIGGGVDATRAFDGLFTEWGADLSLSYRGPRQSELNVNLAPNQEYFEGTTYRNFRYSIYGEIQATRDVALSLAIRAGETIDFNNARAADFIVYSPTANINLGRRISAELSYDFQRLDTKSGARIFDLHLPQARLLYHFSRRAFVRTILQYRTVDRVTSENQRLLTQLLFSYRVNAQTVFLAGYSDNYEGERALERVNRAVFVKVGYAWLF